MRDDFGVTSCERAAGGTEAGDGGVGGGFGLRCLEMPVSSFAFLIMGCGRREELV